MEHNELEYHSSSDPSLLLDLSFTSSLYRTILRSLHFHSLIHSNTFSYLFFLHNYYCSRSAISLLSFSSNHSLLVSLIMHPLVLPSFYPHVLILPLPFNRTFRILLMPASYKLSLVPSLQQIQLNPS